jgi:hypothetical protein
MPPRHAYWTIIVDDQPTSFRAHELEELLATFNRLRQKHPNTQLKWFERGQLWESRDAAREQGFGRGERRWEGSRPERHGDRRDSDWRGPSEPRSFRDSPDGRPLDRPSDRDEPAPRRDRNWRPGGEHRDPRQKYKDAKNAKWDRYKQNIRKRWEEKQRERPVEDHGALTPPHGDPMRPKLQDRGVPPEWTRDDRRSDRPREERTFRRDGDRRGGWKPKGPPGGGDNRRDRSEGKPTGPSKRPWASKPPGVGNRPWSAKPGGGAKRPWGAKPAGAAKRPWGAKPGGGKRSWGSNAGGAKKSWGPPRRPRGPRKPRGDDE